MDDSFSSEEPSRARRRPRRIWIALAIVAATAAGIWALQESELWLRDYLAMAAAAAGFALLSVWLFIWGLRSTKARLIGLAVWLAGVGGLAIVKDDLVRAEGSAGSGMPELRWAWESDPPELAPLDPSGDAAAGELPPPDADGGPWFPRFLGSGGLGVLDDSPPLVTDWERHPPELVWRRPIGDGWSGFSIAAGRAVTQEQRGAQEAVTCYALETGDLIWAHRNDARFDESMGGIGPRATPTIDGDRVYAMGATGILDCLSLADGSLIWSRQILAEPGKNLSWGKSSSPLIWNDLVVVTGGAKPGPALLAFAKDTGDRRWEVGEEAAAYASPVAAVVGGVEQILAVNAESAAGHDPATGAPLWRFKWPGTYPKVAQPVPVSENRVLLSASYNAGTFLVELEPAADGSSITAREIWETNRLKTKFSSAVVRDGFAYGLDEGRLACIDLADGERMWRGEKYGYGQNLLIGDVILIQAERGDVALVAADPSEFRELGRLDALDGKSWNPPALAGEYLLVRNAEEAACYRVTREAAAP